MTRYGVIMAGGGGTRFWPLSRQRTPKQLLNLSGKNSMINEAVDRMSTVIEKGGIFIVTADYQVAAIATETQGSVLTENILAEPAPRNTAACIGYSAMEILRKHGDGVMLITPADHYIQNVLALTEIFHAALQTAEEQDKLVTIGLKPSFPSTGFGYIQYDTSAAGSPKTALAFHEKPDAETAERYVQSGQYLWNSGMFVWKASVILRKLQEYAPDIFAALDRIGSAMDTPQEREILYDIYPKIRGISIDYAVMEPGAGGGDVLVIPGECGWNDVGSWDMLDVFHELDQNGNIFIGDVTAVDARDTVIYSSSRTVTAADVENLVIVETPDAVMVCRKDLAQDVKKIVDALKKAGRKELL